VLQHDSELDNSAGKNCGEEEEEQEQEQEKGEKEDKKDEEFNGGYLRMCVGMRPNGGALAPNAS